MKGITVVHTALASVIILSVSICFYLQRSINLTKNSVNAVYRDCEKRCKEIIGARRDDVTTKCLSYRKKEEEFLEKVKKRIEMLEAEWGGSRAEIERIEKEKEWVAKWRSGCAHECAPIYKFERERDFDLRVEPGSMSYLKSVGVQGDDLVFNYENFTGKTVVPNIEVCFFDADGKLLFLIRDMWLITSLCSSGSLSELLSFKKSSATERHKLAASDILALRNGSVAYYVIRDRSSSK